MSSRLAVRFLMQGRWFVSSFPSKCVAQNQFKSSSRAVGICVTLGPSKRNVYALSTPLAQRHFSTRNVSQNDIRPSDEEWKKYLVATDPETESILAKDMLVFPDFLSEEEEKSILNEIEPYMRRLRYEYDHWDNAIHGYRETEKLKWNKENKKILQRVRELAFPAGIPQIAYVHVLDISKEGYIKPHVDAVRFCGNTIAGMCLLSSCVMRLALEKDSSRYGDVLLKRRSLYVMNVENKAAPDIHKARYDYTHEVLPDDQSVFKGEKIPRDRRVSVICRNEPENVKN
ncbi:hypothetical protein BaRGS_00012814 [Batillaria attramentaria]|uniref:Alpha-ketoglutarate-dependent dioxygenase AlkB-like domain-containing protein n=1 Tax=Batillaria attramentaria TaxID=370345 RepID=A0ABD0L8D7_9CAEN